MDTIIRNLRLLEAGAWRESSIAIEGGRIAERGELSGAGAKEEIDAGGAYCLPGAVDLHVHFNEPGREDWEGFETGSLAAAVGGVTTLAEMPLNSIPSTTDVDALKAKRAAVEGKSYSDYGLWGGVVPGNAKQLLPLAKAGVMGFKAFMSPSGTAEFENSGVATLREAMRRIADTGLRLAVHAEDPAVLKRAADELKRKRTAADWEAARPVEAELAAVERLIELSGQTGCPVTVVHVSAPPVLDLIFEAKAAGVDILCETCPHYLLLSLRDADRIGSDAKCAPPLREAGTVSEMRRRVFEGRIDTIGSDHSPSPPEMKRGLEFYEAWGGIAGVQHGLPLLLDRAKLRKAERIAALQAAFAATPAEAVGFQGKGRLEPGCDADFFLVEPLENRARIREGELRSRHRCSPYTALRTGLRIRQTWLRGVAVQRDGHPCASARGRFLKGRAASE